MSELWKRRGLWVLILVGMLLFCYRGVYRGIRHQLTNDFFGIYTISRAWVAGDQLYSTRVFIDTFQQASGYTLGKNTLPLAARYTAIPATVPIIAPFSMFRWQQANTAWVLVGAGVLALMLWKFAKSASRPQRNTLVFFACCFLLGPIQTGLAAVNITPLLVGLMGLSYLFYRREQTLSAGILLGIVGCCKPHIAGAMVLILLADRAWKTLSVAVATGLVSSALFVARLAVSSIPWWHDFLSRTRYFGSPGDANDFSLANSARYELTNLQVILGSITSSRMLANAVAIGIGLCLVAAWWIAVRRQGKTNLLAFAAINVILLLPSYHRFDDASVLVFLYAAAFLGDSEIEVRKLAIAAALIFALPVPAALVYLAESGRIPHTLLAEKYFQLTFLTFQIWFLLTASVLLLHQLWTTRASQQWNSGGVNGMRSVQVEADTAIGGNG